MATDVTSSDTAAAANGLPPGTDLVRLKDIASDLRCLVCQNQTIADSNAGLAVDLRNQVAKLMSQGKTDTEIKQYMVDRYGEFVLYDPPFSVSNALLWVGPFILVRGRVDHPPHDRSARPSARCSGTQRSPARRGRGAVPARAVTPPALKLAPTKPHQTLICRSSPRRRPTRLRVDAPSSARNARCRCR
ncbi:MAG: cytochrome c-type biogenesis protein CcmH [Betaproteobacteria bacterium]|nr:cytochrome c-type biogenesis protein CcmH [Betaproteobacteria bacterium]